MGLENKGAHSFIRSDIDDEVMPEYRLSASIMDFQV
jgi:hypothetical protein